MLIELVKKNATKTSRGILSKAWYKIDGKLCLVKGNSVDQNGVIGHEPYSEVMASNIAEFLHFNHLPYYLMRANLFPDVKVHRLKHALFVNTTFRKTLRLSLIIILLLLNWD